MSQIFQAWLVRHWPYSCAIISTCRIIPRFNFKRMVVEYLVDSCQYALCIEGESETCRLVARVQSLWRTDQGILRVNDGDSLKFEVAVKQSGLTPEDVVVKILIDYNVCKEPLAYARHYRFEFVGVRNETGGVMWQS
jgi:hypothetical protein